MHSRPSGRLCKMLSYTGVFNIASSTPPILGLTQNGALDHSCCWKIAVATAKVPKACITAIRPLVVRFYSYTDCSAMLEDHQMTLLSKSLPCLPRLKLGIEPAVKPSKPNRVKEWWLISDLLLTRMVMFLAIDEAVISFWMVGTPLP